MCYFYEVDVIERFAHEMTQSVSEFTCERLSSLIAFFSEFGFGCGVIFHPGGACNALTLVIV